MAKVQVRLANVPRHPTYPEGDDALGEHLWSMIVDKLTQGVPRPALFTFFAESVQIVDALPLVGSAGDAHRAISAFASQPGAEAVASLGVMVRRQGNNVIGQFVVAFVEWSDGRWWSCVRPLDARGAPLRGTEDDVQRAWEGASKPGGLGAWFRRARYEGITLKLEGELVN